MLKTIILFITLCFSFCVGVTCLAQHGGCEAAFSYSQDPGSLNINFTDASSSDSHINSWLWDFGDGLSSTHSNPDHSYAHAGTYTVCLTIQDESGCHDGICHTIVVDEISSACHASFTFTTMSDGTVEFTDQSSGPNPITSWHWDFGDGHTSNDQNPVHVYAHEGNYHVCLTVSDHHGCTSHVCHALAITLHGDNCHAAFHVHPTHDMATFQFSDASTSGSAIASWLWDFGDGTMDSIADPEHTYSHGGTYEVCLTITDTHGCHDTQCHHITVHDMSLFCHASFIPHMQTGNAIYFENTSVFATAHTTWFWEFGDGQTSTEENPLHEYDTTGIYNVCLMMMDTVSGCASHSCHHVTLHVHHPNIHRPNEIEYPSNQLHAGSIVEWRYNNPAEDQLVLSLKTIKNTAFQFRLMDMSGRAVYEESGITYPGEEDLFIDVHDLIPGAYIISIATESQIKTSVLTVLR